MFCKLCNTDPASEKHHTLPKSRGGRGKETIDCCSDCGKQIHMLFNNHELACMTLHHLMQDPRMIKYLEWKKKHPGVHTHKMSKEVKKWKKTHR